MTPSLSYCAAVRAGQFSDLHTAYHELEYGIPPKDDNALFGRLLLEINQAGLSWDIVLKKKESIMAAYADFDIAKIAAFTEKDIETMLENPGIIRMKKKIVAIVYNAQQVQAIQRQHHSFKKWLDLHTPQSEEAWVKQFQKTFRFTGKEITKEFLMASGYLPGAHDKDCPMYSKALAANAAWTKS